MDYAMKHYRVRWLACVALLGLPGCLYDGEGTRGLPCNVDADCGAQQCVERICGGPDAGSGDESAGESGSETGEPPTPQSFDEPCTPGDRRCLGNNTLEFCDDNAKLSTFRCEAACGMGVATLGCGPGNEGLDVCFCDF